MTTDAPRSGHRHRIAWTGQPVRTLAVVMGLVLLCAACKSRQPERQPATDTESPRVTIDLGTQDTPTEKRQRRQTTRRQDGRRDPAPARSGASTSQRAKDYESGQESRRVTEPPQPSSAQSSEPSGREQQTARVTPLDQSAAKDDLEVTRQIRRALIDDDRLSKMAKNVQVITQDGRVMLKRRVANADERDRIVAAARRIAGPQVDDRLDVRTP